MGSVMDGRERPWERRERQHNLLRYLEERKSHAHKQGSAVCERFEYDDLRDMVDALTDYIERQK